MGDCIKVHISNRIVSGTNTARFRSNSSRACHGWPINATKLSTTASWKNRRCKGLTLDYQPLGTNSISIRSQLVGSTVTASTYCCSCHHTARPTHQMWLSIPWYSRRTDRSHLLASVWQCISRPSHEGEIEIYIQRCQTGSMRHRSQYWLLVQSSSCH